MELYWEAAAAAGAARQRERRARRREGGRASNRARGARRRASGHGARGGGRAGTGRAAAGEQALAGGVRAYVDGAGLAGRHAAADVAGERYVACTVLGAMGLDAGRDDPSAKDELKDVTRAGAGVNVVYVLNKPGVMQNGWVSATYAAAFRGEAPDLKYVGPTAGTWTVNFTPVGQHMLGLFEWLPGHVEIAQGAW